MKSIPWRKCVAGVLSASLLNLGTMSVASAAIVDTSALVTTDRAADLGAIRTHLAQTDVRAQMTRMGVDAAAVERRISRLSDSELQQLAADLRSAPAGGDALELIGAVFVVLLILEVTGVIDIFKKN